MRFDTIQCRINPSYHPEHASGGGKNRYEKDETLHTIEILIREETFAPPSLDFYCVRFNYGMEGKVVSETTIRKLTLSPKEN